MKHHRAGVAALVCLGTLVGLSGCVSLGRTEPAQEHYVLGSRASLPTETPPAVSFDLALGVRRSKLASYLASPFMVVRRGTNEVDFAEFHRWGEPLGMGINRVVAGALIRHGFREVAVAPWPARARYSYVIQIDVVRFEGVAPADSDSLEGGVQVLATWKISRPLEGSPLATGTTDYTRQGWRVGDYSGLVALLEEGLGVLANDVAAAIAGLPPITEEPLGR